LRAQWRGLGFDYEYLLGREFSKFPANSFIIRRADFEDAAKKELYETYLRGWAMGLEFGHQNPRAATHIVVTQFPYDLAATYKRIDVEVRSLSWCQRSLMPVPHLHAGLSQDRDQRHVAATLGHGRHRSHPSAGIFRRPPVRAYSARI
jgi:hypothetical protein